MTDTTGQAGGLTVAIDQAARTGDLAQLRRLAERCYDIDRDLWDRCGRELRRIERESGAAMGAAEYPPAPMDDSHRCFECWHYHQRRAWKWRRPDRYGPRTPAAVAIPDDCAPGGVRVVDELIRAPVAIWRCDYGHEDFDGY